jgi:excinuclease ABC subunit B
MKRLTEIQYERNDINFTRGKFRARGDVVEIFPVGSTKEQALRIEFFGDEVERISEFEVVSGNVTGSLSHAAIFPASHHIVGNEKLEKALQEIEREMEEQEKFFIDNHKLIEAQRIVQRTKYDLEMLREIGICKGVENYSRVLAGRPAGSTPTTLIDHFPKDFLMLVDESHVTLPQVRGMYGGDAARKKNLIEYGFRLPSAYDNRPMNFDEFYNKLNQVIFVSATPSDFEKERSSQVVEQIIRPTGLLDPKIEVKPVEGQIEDLLSEINTRTSRNERVLVTTLTKRMAEDLTKYLEKYEIRVRYMHHDIDTMERMEIIRDLRLGEFDVLVGINLLREGLDLPEVSLVAILDADKEGFLRSETSLVQTIGRAARNSGGTVIMYADKITRSMNLAITETERRRSIQEKYNLEHGIIPKTIVKNVRDVLEITKKDVTDKNGKKRKLTKAEKSELVSKYTKIMRDAAKVLDFEQAAYYRDLIAEIENS